MTSEEFDTRFPGLRESMHVNTNELTATYWVRITRKLEVMSDDIRVLWSSEVCNEHIQTDIANELADVHTVLRRVQGRYRQRALNELKRIGKQAPLF